MKPFNLEEYLKNPSRKVVTRDGRNVTIHCTNCIGTRPVIAEAEGDNYSLEFDKYGGYFFAPSKNDLFFAPEKHEGWVNIYRSIFMGTHAGTIFNSREEAERSARENALNEKVLDSYLTTIKIEWEE